MFAVTGKFVDIEHRRIYPAKVHVDKGNIALVEIISSVDSDAPFILPGFIDSHVHIESSMLIPSEFARLAVVHGTVATVSDPHEIANVCGIEGVTFMIENGGTVPFKFNFGAPSCVPATMFETAGAALDVAKVAALLKREEIKYLSEMMNFPGVLTGEEDVIQKIKIAHELGKPVDGHAPGLRGDAAKKYIDAGISTDHECFTYEEALEKLTLGMKILIREGSAAKNFEALIDLLHDYPDKIMFCSDDKHPDSLVAGHINQLCARAVAKGINIYNVLQAACINPVKHYKLSVGLLKKDDPADFILVKDLIHFEVIQTYINGNLVADNGQTLIVSQPSTNPNNFNCEFKKPSDFIASFSSEEKIPIIEALDGQLITHSRVAIPKKEGNNAVSDIANDILKIAVVNRYHEAPPAISFIKNFGLKNGAIASSVAHDSHNIVAVGVTDKSICQAINLIIKNKGGISCVMDSNNVEDQQEMILPLPVAGLMSREDGYLVAKKYTAIDAMAKKMGSNLSAPFMTLSFMALLVIPELKLSDKGLFDGIKFELIYPHS